MADKRVKCCGQKGKPAPNAKDLAKTHDAINHRGKPTARVTRW